MKQILFIKEQIPITFDKLREQHEKKQNDVESNQQRVRLNSKEMKISKLLKTMDECSQSVLNLFRYHYRHQDAKNNQDSDNKIASVDVLILFGKSLTNPLETYSLRLYMNSNDDKSDINDKTKGKIQTIVARKLQSIDALWDAQLKLTECKILANINNDMKSNQYLYDAGFSVKHNLNFRSPLQRGKGKKNKKNLYLMDFWNKDTTKILVKNMSSANDKEDKNKENVTPSIFVHEIENIMNGENADCDDLNNDRTWFLSNFSFKGIAV